MRPRGRTCFGGLGVARVGSFLRVTWVGALDLILVTLFDRAGSKMIRGLRFSLYESIGGDKNFFKQKGRTFELIFFNTTNVSGMVNLLGDIEENW